jgi:hypothetical protein
MVSRNILGDIVLFVCAEFFGLFLSEPLLRDQEANRPISEPFLRDTIQHKI